MEFSNIKVMGNARLQEQTLNTMLDEFVDEIKDFTTYTRTTERPYPELTLNTSGKPLSSGIIQGAIFRWTGTGASNA